MRRGNNADFMTLFSGYADPAERTLFQPTQPLVPLSSFLLMSSALFFHFKALKSARVLRIGFRSDRNLPGQLHQLIFPWKAISMRGDEINVLIFGIFSLFSFGL
jgi:hypothetical protein